LPREIPYLQRTASRCAAHGMTHPLPLIQAKAGIRKQRKDWIPAFAGMSG